jgi:hypothetical protein
MVMVRTPVFRLFRWHGPAGIRLAGFSLTCVSDNCLSELIFFSMDFLKACESASQEGIGRGSADRTAVRVALSGPCD